MALASLLRRWLILAHRYLGIAIGLLVVVWFASGILMIYSGGMPEISQQQRLDRLAPVDISKIQVTPADAAARAGFSNEWTGYGDGRVTLLSILSRPAYRFGDEATVFADTGDVMRDLSADQAKQVASGYSGIPQDKLHLVGTLENVDQWTIELGERLPLHKFAADDPDATEIYVQPKSGEVAMLTTRNTRILAWFSAIPHWVYFTSFRRNNSVWYQFIVWTSGIACVLAVLGLILAVTQFRRTRPFNLAYAVPYKGWLRWHYLTGAIFGIFTITWAFSGLLSMDPFEWTRAEGLPLPPDTFSRGLLDLNQYSTIRSRANQTFPSVCGQAMKEIEFVRIFTEPYYLVRCNTGGASDESNQPNRHLISATSLAEKKEPFSTNTLVARIADVLPGVGIREQQVLTEYDSYYRSRGRQAPLPVLRVKLDDPAQTWFYIDPQTARVVGEAHRLSRLKRWLYTGLHDLDFSFWYDRRPLWDIAVIVLLLGGLASSTIGLCLGIKRLFGFGHESRELKVKTPTL